MITARLTVGHLCRLSNALGWAMYAEVQYLRTDRTRTPHVGLAADDIRDLLRENPAERQTILTHMRNAVRWARPRQNLGGVL
ncbi:MAG: hypothetical protein E6R03_13560 [Hyphomicrobiaceae bacterium]|nr:MAG: hypothetical protein E6R03_13560 [Hyphomicrobiaceae bacterium]